MPSLVSIPLGLMVSMFLITLLVNTLLVVVTNASEPLIGPEMTLIAPKLPSDQKQLVLEPDEGSERPDAFFVTHTDTKGRQTFLSYSYDSFTNELHYESTKVALYLVNRTGHLVSSEEANGILQIGEKRKDHVSSSHNDASFGWKRQKSVDSDVDPSDNINNNRLSNHGFHKEREFFNYGFIQGKVNLADYPMVLFVFPFEGTLGTLGHLKSYYDDMDKSCANAFEKQFESSPRDMTVFCLRHVKRTPLQFVSSFNNVSKLPYGSVDVSSKNMTLSMTARDKYRWWSVSASVQLKSDRSLEISYQGGAIVLVQHENEEEAPLGNRKQWPRTLGKKFEETAIDEEYQVCQSERYVEKTDKIYNVLPKTVIIIALPLNRCLKYDDPRLTNDQITTEMLRPNDAKNVRDLLGAYMDVDRTDFDRISSSFTNSLESFAFMAAMVDESGELSLL